MHKNVFCIFFLILIPPLLQGMDSQDLVPNLETRALYAEQLPSLVQNLAGIKKKLLKRLPKKKKCSICLSLKLNKMFKKFSCGHSNTCNNCIKIMCKNALNERNVRNLSCPALLCKKLIELHELRSVIMNKGRMYDLNDHYLKHYLNSKKDIKNCPNLRCDYSFIVGNSLCSVQCPKCLHVFCQNCLRSHNAIIPCFVANLWRSDSEIVSIQAINRITKCCPSCNVAIEKNDGCKHMTCTQCAYEFCWECLDKYYNEHECVIVY